MLYGFNRKNSAKIFSIIKKEFRRKRKSFDRDKKKGGGLKRETILSVLQIGFFAAAGLILVSFSRQGAVLVRANDMLTMYVGWAAILIPFILLSFGFFLSKLRIPLGQANVTIGSLLFFVSITTLTRSGYFGQGAWDGVVALITSAGAFVVLL